MALEYFGQWQLSTCVFGSGVGRVLPFFGVCVENKVVMNMAVLNVFMTNLEFYHV